MERDVNKKTCVHNKPQQKTDRNWINVRSEKIKLVSHAATRLFLNGILQCKFGRTLLLSLLLSRAIVYSLTFRRYEINENERHSTRFACVDVFLITANHIQAHSRNWIVVVAVFFIQCVLFCENECALVTMNRLVGIILHFALTYREQKYRCELRWKWISNPVKRDHTHTHWQNDFHSKNSNYISLAIKSKVNEQTLKKKKTNRKLNNSIYKSVIY